MTLVTLILIAAVLLFGAVRVKSFLLTVLAAIMVATVIGALLITAANMTAEQWAYVAAAGLVAIFGLIGAMWYFGPSVAPLPTMERQAEAIWAQFSDVIDQRFSPDLRKQAEELRDAHNPGALLALCEAESERHLARKRRS